MHDANTLKAPFRATLEASLAELRVLRDILLEEQRALSGGDAASLEQAVRQKNDCLAQLEHSVRAREQMLQQVGLPGGLGGAERFVSQHFAPDELAETWHELLTLSREVAELNDHNGKLALAGERHARQALGILTGRPASPDTYSPRLGGSVAGGHSLGKC